MTDQEYQDYPKLLLEFFIKHMSFKGLTIQNPIVLAEIGQIPYEVVSYFVKKEFIATEDFVFIFKPNGMGCCQLAPKSHKCGQISVKAGEIFVIKEVVPLTAPFTSHQYAFLLKIGHREIMANTRILGKEIVNGRLNEKDPPERKSDP